MHVVVKFRILGLSIHATIKEHRIGGVKNILCWVHGYVFHGLCMFSISLRDQYLGARVKGFGTGFQ